MNDSNTNTNDFIIRLSTRYRKKLLLNFNDATKQCYNLKNLGFFELLDLKSDFQQPLGKNL